LAPLDESFARLGSLVAKQAPAGICPDCGEEYIDEGVAERILSGAEDLARIGAQVQIR
jgi:hypothetical protein